MPASVKRKKNDDAIPMIDISLLTILLAALVATASPGPATLAIAGTSMSSGRWCGLAVASGVTTGSLIWSTSAALGLGAVMLANAWIVEILRYVGASYLIFLAIKSARSALSTADLPARSFNGGYRALFLKGLALHLANPKAIFFFGSLYAIGVPATASSTQLFVIVASVGLLSFTVFHGYALLFSTPAMIERYAKSRRWLEGLFAIGFGFAGLRVLLARGP